MKNKTLLAKLISACGKKALSMIPFSPLGDKLYCVLIFIISHKRLPTKKLQFNDVLHRMKINGYLADPLRRLTTDKELAKYYIQSVLGKEYVIPTYAVLHNPEEVEAYNFPARCSIKPTHASGFCIMRENNEPLDTNEIKRWFSINYYDTGREIHYKHLKPKVIVEPIVFNNALISDYRIFCYNGKAKFIMLDVVRQVPRSRKLYDIEWNDFECDTNKSRSLDVVPKPKNLDEMLRIAEKLSVQFPFVRIDMFSNGEVCKVGEITHSHTSACERFFPAIYEKKISNLIFN